MQRVIRGRRNTAHSNGRQARKHPPLRLNGVSGRRESPTSRSRTLPKQGLDLETFQLVQIAALAAVDGSAVSWLVHLGAAEETDLDLERCWALVPIAPTIGTPRVVAAGAKIVRAVGIIGAVAAAEDQLRRAGAWGVLVRPLGI